MTFFQGKEEYSLDQKGRLSIPQYMRREMNPEARDTLTLAYGYRKCILAYPLDEWKKKIYSKLIKINQFNQENDKVITFFVANSKEVTLDAQNRITIPKNFLQYAKIENKVLIVGKIDHIEIWNPDEFARVYTFDENELAKIFEKVLGNNNSNNSLENIIDEEYSNLNEQR
ncbi:MAG: division/cell wall cluster transcriptional repressor MraZ [Candidatus Kapaibacteriales bacterium]